MLLNLLSSKAWLIKHFKKTRKFNPLDDIAPRDVPGVIPSFHDYVLLVTFRTFSADFLNELQRNPLTNKQALRQTTAFENIYVQKRYLSRGKASTLMH